MIYTVTLNPALDKTARVNGFAIDSVNRVAECRQDPGGKGINVSKVVISLGGESRALAVLGGTTGKAVAAALEGLAIPCWAFDVPGETRTNLKIVDPVNDTHTDVNEPGPQVTEDILANVLRYLVAGLHAGDIAVLSGRLPPGARRTPTRCGRAPAPKRARASSWMLTGTRSGRGLRASPTW